MLWIICIGFKNNSTAIALDGRHLPVSLDFVIPTTLQSLQKFKYETLPGLKQFTYSAGFCEEYMIATIAVIKDKSACSVQLTLPIIKKKPKTVPEGE